MARCFMPPKTHDLEKLLKDCMKYDSRFDQLREDVRMLSPFATYARYPDDRFNIDREEVDEAIKRAERILRFVKSKVETIGQTPQLNIFET